ncbi:MAG: hypothetical protein FJ086_00125 [Deltaproteobacteria bacterium]|nr:hypothetical protein [Deltaproteobacteria bacterium]
MLRSFTLVAVSLLAAPAFAQVIEVSEPIIRSQGWSTMAGLTVGEARTVVTGQATFPGLSVGVLRGMHSRVDAGGLFSFNYGVEGNAADIAPELKLQGRARASLYQGQRVNLGAEFSPGALVVFRPNDQREWGMTVPMALTLGIPVGSALHLHAAVECPLWFDFASTKLRVPILAGGGAEYFLDRSVALTLNLRTGPTLQTWAGTGVFTFQSLLGVAWRL